MEIWQTFLSSHKLVRRITKELEQEKELSGECKVDVKAANCWKEPCITAGSWEMALDGVICIFMTLGSCKTYNEF